MKKKEGHWILLDDVSTLAVTKRKSYVHVFSKSTSEEIEINYNAEWRMHCWIYSNYSFIHVLLFYFNKPKLPQFFIYKKLKYKETVLSFLGVHTEFRGECIQNNVN